MLDQFEGRPVPGTEGGAFPLFSPDGSWIVYGDLASPKIRKVPVHGGTSTVLCDGNLAAGADWGDDNTIVFAGASGLMRVSADGGTPDSLTTVDTAAGETAHQRPQFLPGGRHVLFTVVSADGPQFAAHEVGRTGHRVLAKGGANGRYAASGHLLYGRGTTLFAVPFDAARLDVTGTEVPVVEDVSVLGPQSTFDYAVSRNGVLAYFSGGGGQGTILAWADDAGRTTRLPGQPRQRWGTGRLSPDGTRVANSIHNDKDEDDIWVVDAGRGTMTRLTFGGHNEDPVWSHDGRRIFFRGRADGKYALYAVPADGSARAAVLLSTDAAASPSSVTPDGKTLLYQQAGEDKRQRILMTAIDGTGAPQPHHEPAGVEGDAQVSPDGRWLAYRSNESGRPEIYVRPFARPGEKTRISLNGGSAPRWARSGRALHFWANAPVASLTAVDVINGPAFQTGPARELFKRLPATTWDVTPDPKRFLIELNGSDEGSTLAIVTNWFDELRRRAPARK